MRWSASLIGAISVVGCVVDQGDSGATTEQGAEEQTEEVSEAVLTNRIFCKEGEHGGPCSDRCVAQKSTATPPMPFIHTSQASAMASCMPVTGLYRLDGCARTRTQTATIVISRLVEVLGHCVYDDNVRHGRRR